MCLFHVLLVSARHLSLSMMPAIIPKHLFFWKAYTQALLKLSLYKIGSWRPWNFQVYSFNSMSQNSILTLYYSNVFRLSLLHVLYLKCFCQDILTMKTGAVQNSPPDKTIPEPGPYSPVWLLPFNNFTINKHKLYLSMQLWWVGFWHLSNPN